MKGLKETACIERERLRRMPNKKVTLLLKWMHEWIDDSIIWIGWKDGGCTKLNPHEVYKASKGILFHSGPSLQKSSFWCVYVFNLFVIPCITSVCSLYCSFILDAISQTRKTRRHPSFKNIWVFFLQSMYTF